MVKILAALSCFLLIVQVATVQSQVSSVEFNQAFDAAMARLVSSMSFQNYVANNLPFTVPQCSPQLPSFPATNPIPSSVKSLKMCYEDVTELEQVYFDLYRMIGKGIVDQLNSNYKTSLEAQYVLVNTSTGFFDSMSNALTNAKCDIVVSNAIITEERSKIVTFASCPYGFTFDGFLRSELDMDIYVNATSTSQLNQPYYKIGYYAGTLYEGVANQSFPLSQKVPLGYDEQFEMILKKKIHATIGYAYDLGAWQRANTKTCPYCYVKTFGNGRSFGAFVARTSRMSEGSGKVSYSSLMACLVLIVVSLFIGMI